MAKRKSTGKRKRFNVFKRDKFTCQYCGSTPPTAVLVIDHILPVSKGGSDDDHNLITSCEKCNQGKAGGLLSEVPKSIDSTLAEQVERQEQLAEYNKFLMKARKQQDDAAVEIGTYWNDRLNEPEKAGMYTFGPDRIASVRTFLKRLPKAEILDAVDLAISRKSPSPRDDRDAFKYFCGICWSKIREREGGKDA